MILNAIIFSNTADFRRKIMNTENNIKEIFSYKKCEKNRNGNYCLKFPLWQRILSLAGFIFALFIFYVEIKILAEGNIPAFIGGIVFMLCCGCGIDRIFFKMELTDTELIIRHWFKSTNISFYQLKKYSSAPDFFIFIYPQSALLKTGDSSYISIPMLSLKPVAFLEKLFEEKLRTEEKTVKILSRGFIEIDISPKTFKDYVKRTVLILGVTFILIFTGVIICVSLFASMPNFVIFSVSALIITAILLIFYYISRKIMELSGEREAEKIYYNILKNKLEKRNKKILSAIIFIFILIFFSYFYMYYLYNFS